MKTIEPAQESQVEHIPGEILTPETKRLLLSAHIGLVWKKLRRGQSVEEREIVALLPFTVPDGWRPNHDAPLIDSSDEEWNERLAAVR